MNSALDVGFVTDGIGISSSSSFDQSANISTITSGSKFMNAEQRPSSSKLDYGKTDNESCRNGDDLFWKLKASYAPLRKGAPTPNTVKTNWPECPSLSPADSALLSQSVTPPNTDFIQEHRPCPSPSESKSFSLDVLGTTSSTPLWNEDSKGFTDFPQSAEIPIDLSSIQVALTLEDVSEIAALGNIEPSVDLKTASSPLESEERWNGHESCK